MLQLVRHDERGSFESALEPKPKRARQGFSILAANALRQPLGLAGVEIFDVHERVVHKTPPHPARCIRLMLHLPEPFVGRSRRIGGAVVGDELAQTPMMHLEKNRHCVVVDEPLDVAFERLDDPS